MNYRNYRNVLALATILLLGLMVGCSGADTGSGGEGDEAASTAATFEVDPATAGGITGKVSFSGKAPRRRKIDMSAESSCGSGVLTENFVPGDGGTIQQVFVYIKDDFGGAKFEAPSEPVVLDQKGCLYSPHVVGAMAGQTIQYVNSDSITHNVHPVPQNNRQWNNSQSAGAEPIEKSFARAEIGLAVKCNIHPWMRAYVHVMNHPYFAVTGSDGTFEIKNLPPGEYTLATWQEGLGEKEMQVTIGDSETKEVEISYSGD